VILEIRKHKRRSGRCASVRICYICVW